MKHVKLFKGFWKFYLQVGFGSFYFLDGRTPGPSSSEDEATES